MVTMEALSRLWHLINSPDKELQELGIQSTIKYLNIYAPDFLVEEYTARGICGAEIAHRAYQLGKQHGENYLKNLINEPIKNQTQVEQGVIQED